MARYRWDPHLQQQVRVDDENQGPPGDKGDKGDKGDPGESGTALLTALFPLERTPAIPSIPDDEFASPLIDGKWTVVAGTPGFVDPTNEPADLSGGIYDLTSLTGAMLIQPDSGGNVAFRQDYELPDGKAIILRVRPTIRNDNSILNNEIRCILAVNDDDGSWDSGNFVSMFFDTEPGDTRLASWNGMTLSQASRLSSNGAFYFAIGRLGTDYYTFAVPVSGILRPFLKYSVGSVLSNIWIYLDAGTLTGNLPVTAVDWIREADFTGGAKSFYNPWG